MVNSIMAHDVGHVRPTFQLLGGFHPQEGLNSRHQSLVAYLVLRHPEPVPRAELAFKLWVDSSEEQALTNLRHELASSNWRVDMSELMMHYPVRLVRLEELIGNDAGNR